MTILNLHPHYHFPAHPTIASNHRYSQSPFCGIFTTMSTLTETPSDRFKKHVAFDNVTTGEPTKNNAISFTLNVRHKGYQARRRSRCFMVGVDEHTYSDYALQWLLDELVDDGDDVVCVRVVDKELRLTDKQYRDDADSVMKGIVARNGNNRAINIVLEYAVGKLHTTFQVLVREQRRHLCQILVLTK